MTGCLSACCVPDLHFLLSTLAATGATVQMQILEYHVYAEDAYEESDFDDHSTLHMVEGEAVKVS